jgi:hypothetical protein
VKGVGIIPIGLIPQLVVGHEQIFSEYPETVRSRNTCGKNIFFQGPVRAVLEMN